MIYIYIDFGGIYIILLVVVYYLNKLLMDCKLMKEEILNVDYFNKLKIEDMGKIIFYGIDEYGYFVYMIGCGVLKVVVFVMKYLGEIL